MPVHVAAPPAPQALPPVPWVIFPPSARLPPIDPVFTCPLPTPPPAPHLHVPQCPFQKTPACRCFPPFPPSPSVTDTNPARASPPLHPTAQPPSGGRPLAFPVARTVPLCRSPFPHPSPRPLFALRCARRPNPPRPPLSFPHAPSAHPAPGGQPLRRRPTHLCTLASCCPPLLFPTALSPPPHPLSAQFLSWTWTARLARPRVLPGALPRKPLPARLLLLSPPPLLQRLCPPPFLLPLRPPRLGRLLPPPPPSPRQHERLTHPASTLAPCLGGQPDSRPLGQTAASSPPGQGCTPGSRRRSSSACPARPPSRRRRSSRTT